jgi:Chemotaxis phosphatase CheX
VARASRSMLGLSEGTPPSPADMHDVVGEIGNILGGKLKASLPGPSQLSLPVVVDGQVLDDQQQFMPASKLVAQVAFESEGLPVLVSLWTRGEHAAK